MRIQLKSPQFKKWGFEFIYPYYREPDNSMISLCTTQNLKRKTSFIPLSFMNSLPFMPIAADRSIKIYSFSDNYEISAFKMFSFLFDQVPKVRRVYSSYATLFITENSSLWEVSNNGYGIEYRDTKLSKDLYVNKLLMTMVIDEEDIPEEARILTDEEFTMTDLSKIKIFLDYDFVNNPFYKLLYPPLIPVLKSLKRSDKIRTIVIKDLKNYLYQEDEMNMNNLTANHLRIVSED